MRRWEIGAPEPDELPAGARLGTAAIHGDLIILSDVQGNWRAENLDTWEQVHGLRFGHAGGIIRMAVSTATGMMATAGRDGTIDHVVRVYALDVAALVEIARSRTTRDLTEAECRQYLHAADC